MPFHERDPWREQYFAGVSCPPGVHIPTDDADAYRWNPAHRWVYDKLRIAELQQLSCAPHGISPPGYPVFSKPVINLDGMGLGSCILQNEVEYQAHYQPGHMWMSLLTGDHVSTDAAVVSGAVRWMRHAHGRSLPGGMFDYWTVEAGGRPELDAYLAAFIGRHLGSYTGMLNLESIGGRIIEVHLRLSDQWPDLYGSGWLEAVVRLYAASEWPLREAARRTGFSVALFGPHGRSYTHPDAGLLRRIRELPSISSVQVTFHEGRPAARHAMPPGGFRLAVINAWDLDPALEARELLRRAHGVGR